jgi:toxin ParE1/3/4
MEWANSVLIGEGAEQDLESLVDYIARQHGPADAQRVLDRLMDAVSGLRQLPSRGSHPPELLTLGIKSFRQVFFKPWRVIYEVTDRSVIVHVIVDGRRDLESLLLRRLIGG